MSAATVTYDFVNGTTAVADNVDQNFTDILNYINSNCIVRDGTTQMTGALSLKASTDPTADDHAARRKYVTDRLPVLSSKSPVGVVTVSSASLTDVLTHTLTAPGIVGHLDLVATADVTISTLGVLPITIDVELTVDGVSVDFARVVRTTAAAGDTFPIRLNKRVAYTSLAAKTIKVRASVSNGPTNAIQFANDARFIRIDCVATPTTA